MLLDFGRANWLEKARQQPDKVKQVLQKIKTDGVGPTLEAVRAKLDQPVALGYSNVGVVVERGSGVTEFAVGDRVVSNGPHAEVVSVAKNLAAKVPEGVTDESAAFTVVGAIALQGIRLLEARVGETVVVTGLGLIGLLAVQILKAQGCRVIGLDFDETKLRLAEAMGAVALQAGDGAGAVEYARRVTGGMGVDGVLLTAATKSSEPVQVAAEMCRQRGRIVLVGVTGLELSRDAFYKKELTFQVSCSYGPGRYDAAYEQGGQDYPYGLVRWTAKRNFEAVLQLMAEGRIDTSPLVTHRFKIDEAEQAYAVLQGDRGALGILLEYPERPREELMRRTVVVGPARAAAAGSKVAVIGAGGYATKVLMPALQAAGLDLKVVVANGGVSSYYAARKFGAELASTEAVVALEDGEVGGVVVATRHDSHGRYVEAALRAGKHVFVEKPMALGMEELEAIEKAWREKGGVVTVGYNRRYAPQAVKMKGLLAGVKAPKVIVITVNAGSIPGDHWTQDATAGGGRLVGEGCHFLDLARYLAGSRIETARWERMEADTATLLMRFEDGSQASVHYLANGHRGYPKERVEVFCAGKILQLDNWRKLKGYGWKGFSSMNLWKQDKGNAACVAAWARAMQGEAGAVPPMEEVLEVGRWVVEAAG